MSKRNRSNLSLGLRLTRRTLLGLCICTSAYGTPLPPAELMPEIQQEFVRLYELPDSLLRLQVEPALEIFPEYRSTLVQYLAQQASPERQALLADIAKANEQERLAWFQTPRGRGLIAAGTVAGAAVLAARRDSGSDRPAPQDSAKPTPEPEPTPTPSPEPTPPSTPDPEPSPDPTPDPIPEPDPQPDPVPEPPRVAVPDDFRTAEFNRANHLSILGADYAYARGATGEGVVVAVKDTGVDIDAPELRNQIAPGGDYVTDGGERMSDTGTHGTAVAKALAAEKNDSAVHGVAYDAKLLPIRVLGSGALSDRDQVAREIQYGARVSNNSWSLTREGGGTSRIEDNADGGAWVRDHFGPIYQQGVDAGIVYVWAAGNSGDSQPSSLAALPVLVPGLQGQWLAVVAVDNLGESAGSISSYSNRCGDAAAWCIAAPGQVVVDVGADGQPQWVAGTSIAAPQVSGGVALLMDRFPTLSPEQIVERLLVSASKTGPYSNQAVYGQGLMDLNAATQPIGALMIETSSGRIVPFSAAVLSESSAMGSAIRDSLAKVSLVLKDSLDAPFVYSGTILSANTQAERTRLDTDGYLARFDQEYRTQSLTIEGGLRLDYTTGSEGSGLEALGEVQAWQPLGSDLSLSASFNTDPSWNQGLRSLAPTLKYASLTRAFGNPYLSLDEQASGAGMHWQLGKGWQGGLQIQAGKAPQHFAERKASALQQSVQTEWGYVAPSGLAASVQLGVLNEADRLLGTQSDGLFGDAQARTLFSGLNLALPLNDDWQLYGRYNRGQTRLASSGWMDAGRLNSDSFTLGIIGRPASGWQLGALAYQPLRLKEGRLSTTLPTGLNRDNSVIWNRVDLNLDANGHHMEYEMFFRYDLPVWAITFKGSLLRIEDYNNETGNDDLMLMLNAGMTY
ncbi:S8 family peptidase [Stutzerimonas marianensis]|uniref:S8 family peptidase n=1 Tax=Stutzerimonas marianensis TaxID=2929513 RepID=UPI003C2DD836